MDSAELKGKADQAIQHWYAPDGVLIDADWQVLQFRGHTGFYLEPSGEANYHLLQLARADLKPKLRKAVAEAIERNIAVEEKGLRFEYSGEVREINLQVIPLTAESPDNHFYLVVFERAKSSAASVFEGISASPATTESWEQRVIALEHELAEARDYIRHADQEQETALEELRAANEEIGSANEELRIANEQLESTKEELQSNNQELQNRNEDLRLLSDDLTNLLNAINTPVFIVDRRLRLRHFTPAAAEQFRVADKHLGQSLAAFHHQLPWANLEQLAREAINSLTTETQEIQDEKGHWWSLSVRPYRTMDQRIDGAVLTFVDIDVLQRNLRAAQEARDYADTIKQALLRSNADLQRFASVVSHDLQEPLRTVGSYTQLLIKLYSDRLGPEAHQFAEFVRGGILRMQELIRDLLEYSQVTEAEVNERKLVSSLEALNEALANLHASIEESGARISHGDLPTISYNPRQLIQMFQNLVGNAIKYRRANEPPRIDISAKRQGHEWVFAVRDNGVGFASEHAKHIFGVFKRLHGREYAGTGIGLAICQRIVEHYGGRIWAESEPGVGSLFSFTIPISEEPEI